MRIMSRIVEIVASEQVPLIADERGVVRVAGTRVTLDVVVRAFDAGASPEEIVESFPTLALPDVYAIITYVLRHRADVDGYVATQTEKAEALREKIERRYPTADLRRNLMAQRATS